LRGGARGGGKPAVNLTEKGPRVFFAERNANSAKGRLPIFPAALALTTRRIVAIASVMACK